MIFDEPIIQQIRDYTPEQKPILIQEFTLHYSDKVYQNTLAYLFSDHIVLKIQTKKGNKYFKLNFDFDLIFDLERLDEQKSKKPKLGHPFAIRFQRNNQILVLKNANAPSKMFQWRDALGKKLNQRGFHELFKPIKKVGKGNFATVFLVIKHQDNKKYAAKAFSKQAAFSEDKGKQSLINEIEIMREFDHKNLMKLYDVYESQNSIYVNVQLLEGGQLHDKIKNKYKFSVDEIKTVMRGILQGLQAMHVKNIMHRDLKPQNILLRKDDDFDCVIGDFGLATYTDQEEYLFVRCGTPGYVAPQIVNLKDMKAKYSPVCDLFSLGIIFHILLFRKSPFVGKQYDEVLRQNRACKFNFQSPQYKKLPEQALDLLKRLLQKDPKIRITASQALKHRFLSKLQPLTLISSTLTSSISRLRPSSIMTQKSSNSTQCQSPLMTTKNPQRKQGRLRQDSCLKFKMKQNINIAKGQDSGQTIDRIDSPVLAKKNSLKNPQSRFKRIVQQSQ